MKRMAVHIGLAALFYSITFGSRGAQSTAEVSGTIKDQTGAVLPGVEVTATQTDTALKRTVLTDETGSYILPNLPVGPYRLEAVLPGFRTFIQTGIVLQVGANPVINPVLALGQVSDQIEVQANAALVETRTTGVSKVMDNLRVLELPLNGRQVTDLIVLSGAATIGSIGSFVRGYPTVSISVAGGLSNGVTFLLDGASHNDPFNNLNLPLPFPDALQEFKLETSGLSAQYGQHSAGTVNAVTRSGTNDFHGDLFEFVRNGAFNARNAFASNQDTLKRYQYGGTVGRPVTRKKLISFAGDQETTLRQAPSANIAFVPNAAMLAGDFTAIASSACQSRGPVTLKGGFVNNRINPALF